MLAGAATVEGTRRWRARHLGRCPTDHFRGARDLVLGTIGIGTARGEPSDDVDDEIATAAVRALSAGVNAIDTARNYRDGRSERCVATAVRGAIARGVIARDEVFVASKAGYLPLLRGTPPELTARYLRSIGCDGLLAEVVDGCHCVHPAFLTDQLARSRAALELDTVDLYYLHNPEVQLREIERRLFVDRVRRAFAVLEGSCASGAIRYYGVATWHGLRVPVDDPLHLDLAELCALAREAAGGDGHFAFVQLPLNPLLPEALVASQRVAGHVVPLLLAAEELGLVVIASAAAAGGQPLGDRCAAGALRARLGEAGDSDAQRSLQLARSVPQIASCLVGMRRSVHVDEILAIAKRSPLSLDALAAPDPESG